MGFGMDMKIGNISAITLYDAGISGEHEEFNFGPGISNQYGLYYVISGSGYYYVNDTRYHLMAGSAFMVYPGIEVKLEATKKNPWVCAWVSFAGDGVSVVLDQTDFTYEVPFIRKVRQGDEIWHRVLNITKSNKGDLAQMIDGTGQLYGILSMFIKEKKYDTLEENLYEIVRKSMSYVEKHYSEQLTVTDIADYLGISRSHLFRSFEAVLGKSTKEYLIEYRVEKACELLRDSELSINTIANSLGFENTHCFSSMFHKKQGVSPREFRKTCRMYLA
jgi:AraC-like DNA-binding protein